MKERMLPQEFIDSLLHNAATLIEVAGVMVIVLSVVVSSAYFLKHWLLHRAQFTAIYQDYRANLGRGILLGLEFLVAGDIIGTVAVALTWKNVGILAVIVLIRTFLSFSLETEIRGRVPWRQGRET